MKSTTRCALLGALLALTFNVEKHGTQEAPAHVTELINFYKEVAFPALANAPPRTDANVQYALTIKIQDWDLKFSDDEAYTLDIASQTSWTLTTYTYTGFTRGLETFSQLFVVTENNQYALINVPVFVNDSPAYSHRGIMIDTSRHYISVATLLTTFDAMMYNKMNVFHWHITDDDSFPLVVDAYPGLSDNSKFGPGLVYTAEDVKNVITYALKRGIKVIPEIDSPGHTFSWGAEKSLDSAVLQCGYPIDGQLDPTMNLTYTAVRNIFQQVQTQFPSDVVHFGGDEVSNLCWQTRPSIAQFMKDKGIATYDDLQVYYRQQQYEIFRNDIKSNKSVMYWANEGINLPVPEGEIVQWWGSVNDVGALKDAPNRIVLSYGDVVYLNNGFGDPNGLSTSVYSTWRDVYSKFKLDGFNDFKGQVIGGEACLWSEVNNDATTQNKLWIRASSLGERLWNPTANSTAPNNIFLVTRLVAQQQRMNARGIDAIPVSDEMCTRNVPICFFNH